MSRPPCYKEESTWKGFDIFIDINSSHDVPLSWKHWIYSIIFNFNILQILREKWSYDYYALHIKRILHKFKCQENCCNFWMILCWSYFDPLNTNLTTTFFRSIRGGFSVLVRGLADSERSEPKIFATPLWIFTTPCRGVATFNPLTYKHRADIWLTYCYIHFNFHLKEQL